MQVAKLLAMEYKELQKRAKELGLPYIGVSREELEKSIKEKETSSDVVAGQGVSNKEDAPSKTSATASAKEVSEVNTAFVLDKAGREVRKYSLDIHGEKFADLAYEFAEKNGFSVKLESVKQGIKCPSCGYVFNPY